MTIKWKYLCIFIVDALLVAVLATAILDLVFGVTGWWYGPIAAGVFAAFYPPKWSWVEFRS